MDELEQRKTARTIEAGDVRLSIDLGTAYSKCAIRRGPGVDNPVQFQSGRWVLPSDLAVIGDRVGLALHESRGAVVRDVKTQLRCFPGYSCLSLDHAVQPLSTFEALIFLYRVLVRRGLEEPGCARANIIKITLPSLAFTTRQDLLDLHRKASLAGYYLAVNSVEGWDAELPITRLREAGALQRPPSLELISEPTAALSDRIRVVPEQVFALIDIGAGTTDIAIMARFGDRDSILAQDSVARGGRFLKEVADRIVSEQISGVAISEQDFQDLLRDGRLTVGAGGLTADMLFSDPAATSWLAQVNSCLLKVKAEAQQKDLMRPADFVRWLAGNVYVAGGMGRSQIVREKILIGRKDAPLGVSIPASCAVWETSVGPEATGLFLQLAPSVGALTMSSNTSADLPAPGVVPAGRRKGFEYEDAPG